jgi:hypothetical protein
MYIGYFLDKFGPSLSHNFHFWKVHQFYSSGIWINWISIKKYIFEPEITSHTVTYSLGIAFSFPVNLHKSWDSVRSQNFSKMKNLPVPWHCRKWSIRTYCSSKKDTKNVPSQLMRKCSMNKMVWANGDCCMKWWYMKARATLQSQVYDSLRTCEQTSCGSLRAFFYGRMNIKRATIPIGEEITRVSRICDGLRQHLFFIPSIVKVVAKICTNETV